MGTAREELSSAESNSEGTISEVHPGVDPAKRVAGYVKHTLHAERERILRNSFNRVEPRSNIVSCSKEMVFFSFTMELLFTQARQEVQGVGADFLY